MQRKKQDIIVGVIFTIEKAGTQNALESDRTSIF